MHAHGTATWSHFLSNQRPVYRFTCAQFTTGNIDTRAGVHGRCSLRVHAYQPLARHSMHTTTASSDHILHACVGHHRLLVRLRRTDKSTRKTVKHQPNLPEKLCEETQRKKAGDHPAPLNVLERGRAAAHRVDLQVSCGCRR